MSENANCPRGCHPQKVDIAGPYDEGTPGAKFWRVLCCECGFKGPLRQSEAAAWEEWNTRPIEAALLVRARVAEELLADLLEALVDEKRLADYEGRELSKFALDAMQRAGWKEEEPK